MTGTRKSVANSAVIVPVDDLVEGICSYQPGADVELLKEAYRFAARAHGSQQRKSGAPYFSHPVSVAKLLVDLRLDTATVCAALLHDVVEDTEVPIDELARTFGAEIAALVDGVTKLSKANFTSRQDRAAESFRKMLIAMARDIRVLIIKLCDRLDNMRTLQFMKPSAQERIARETLDIYVPLANRLGIYPFKVELEDLAFRYIAPEAFEELEQQMAKLGPKVRATVEQFTQRLQEDISSQGFAARVTGRPKHMFSIHQAMLEARTAVPNLNDMMTFTVVVESLNDCYSVMGAIHARYTPVPGTIRDYIALPKPNLYRSIHTTVIGPERKRAEIKIRTGEMDAMARRGILHHWHYGERLTGGPDPELVKQIAWLGELASFQNEIETPAEFLDSVKTDLFQKEVYAFTPKGKPLVFPRGATVIDFAYAIHTEIGHHCSGALVNGKPRGVDYVLQDGDIVEITTDPAQHPSKDWLEFVATARARTRIRTYLRNQERDRAEHLGYQLLDTEFHRHGLSLQRLTTNEQATQALLRQLKFESLPRLYRTVGFGQLTPRAVLDGALTVQRSTDLPRKATSFRESVLEAAVRRLSGRNATPPKLSDLDEVIIEYATCCKPIPGDDIVGVVSRGKGITVHRRECSVAFDVATERRFVLRWDPKRRPKLPVDLRVTTTDRPGILGKLGQVFDRHDVNLESYSGRATGDGRAVLLFSFQCSDVHKLRLLLRALRRIRGVHSVERA